MHILGQMCCDDIAHSLVGDQWCLTILYLSLDGCQESLRNEVYSPGLKCWGSLRKRRTLSHITILYVLETATLQGENVGPTL